MADFVDQLTKMIDGTEFSDRVKDKVKELSVKARLRKEAGKKEEDCLTPEEIKELMGLIKVDMILDGMRAKICRTYLGEIDRVLTKFKK